MKTLDEGINCHVCGGIILRKISGYEILHKVSSDCKPCATQSDLCICEICGCVQKVVNRLWQKSIDEIYQAYSIYHQAGGSEQQVFVVESGQMTARSERLLAQLAALVALPEEGRILDVGCGNGALLKAFNQIRPRWSLLGTELNEKYKNEVEQIEQVEAMYSVNMPDVVPGRFNLITMIHLLEHIVCPSDFLMKLGDKLEPDGILVLQLPDYTKNPFDLIIADHATHFTIQSLSRLIQSVGFEIINDTFEWIPKETTIIARKSSNKDQKVQPFFNLDQVDLAYQSIQWLHDIIVLARESLKSNKDGLFGTSIAAAWLCEELGEVVKFFVDEDLNRVGTYYLGRPVYEPQNVPEASHVYITLPPALATKVLERIKSPQVTYHLPPPFKWS